jgi:hypothetical protein
MHGERMMDVLMDAIGLAMFDLRELRIVSMSDVLARATGLASTMPKKDTKKRAAMVVNLENCMVMRMGGGVGWGGKGGSRKGRWIPS